MSRVERKRRAMSGPGFGVGVGGQGAVSSGIGRTGVETVKDEEQCSQVTQSPS